MCLNSKKYLPGNINNHGYTRISWKLSDFSLYFCAIHSGCKVNVLSLMKKACIYLMTKKAYAERCCNH